MKWTFYKSLEDYDRRCRNMAGSLISLAYQRNNSGSVKAWWGLLCMTVSHVEYAHSMKIKVSLLIRRHYREVCAFLRELGFIYNSGGLWNSKYIQKMKTWGINRKNKNIEYSSSKCWFGPFFRKEIHPSGIELKVNVHLLTPQQYYV